MPIMPGATLGMLGGGQLGRMFVMAAQSMGYRVTVLDPAEDSPAGRVADRFLCADYADEVALQDLGTHCAAVTTEFENIPADSLRYLADLCIVSPHADSVSIAQNRSIEKQFLVDHGFAVAPYVAITDRESLVHAATQALFPGILKASQFGYDGKGQRTVQSAAELDAAWADLNEVNCVLEQFVPLRYEVSAVVARSAGGSTQVFPVSQNQHVDGILDVSIVPAPIPQAVAQQAQEMAQQVAEKLNYIGVLCVEFFVLEDGQLLINEIAPRPHNSGHYTIDACYTSQFEQQVRTLCGLPLSSTQNHSAAVMVNILGDLWGENGGKDAGEHAPDWQQVLQHPQAKLHLYGKQEARPKRKMGHFTVLDTVSSENALKQAMQIKALLRPNDPNLNQ